MSASLCVRSSMQGYTLFYHVLHLYATILRWSLPLKKVLSVHLYEKLFLIGSSVEIIYRCFIKICKLNQNRSRNIIFASLIFKISRTNRTNRKSSVRNGQIRYEHSIWCGQQDSNLHALAVEPKSTESTNSTMPAYSFCTSDFYTGRYPRWGVLPDPRYIKTGKPIL